MTEQLTPARRETFRLRLDAATREEAEAKALSWAIAEPNLRGPEVTRAEAIAGVREVFAVDVEAEVVLARAPGWYRLPLLPGGRVDLSELEAELAKVLSRYALGGRLVPLGADVLDAVRRWIGKGGPA